MAYNELLADRLRQALHDRKVHFEEKKMMGGLTFMVDDKMCVGIIKEELMCRIDPESEAEALKAAEARPMDFTGRPMKGYIMVSAIGVDSDADLSDWVQLALDYNPKAKSSKKKKKA